MDMRQSLQTKILIPLGITLFLTIGINTLIHLRVLQNNYLEAIEWRSTTLAQDLSADIVSKFTHYGSLADTELIIKAASLKCKSLYEANRKMHVSYVSVLDGSGTIIAHNDKALWNKQLNNPDLLTALQQRQIITIPGVDYYHTLIPITAENNVYLGTIDVGFPRSIVVQKIWNLLLKAVVPLFLMFLAAFFLVWFFLGRLIIKPISQLVEATASIAHGNLEQDITSATTREFEILSASLTTMRDSIRENIEMLAKKQAEFQAIFNSITDVIVLVDLEWRIIMTNPAFETVLGYSFDEVAGKTTQLFHVNNDEYLQLREKRHRTDSEVSAGLCEIEMRRRDGSIFPSETTGVPVQDSHGGIIGFLDVIRDVTERKKTEEELGRHREHLEELVEERTAELKKMLNLMVGRELRMAELKEKNSNLQSQLELKEEQSNRAAALAHPKVKVR